MAEGTISLSNKQQTMKKVIQIKPIQINEDCSVRNEESVEKYDEEIINAKEILEKIRIKQEQLISKTNTEIEEAKEEWESSRQLFVNAAQKEGFDFGEKNALEKYQTLINQGNHIIELATVDYQSTIETSKETILHLAIHIAEKILHNNLNEKPEKFTHIIKSAVNEIKNQSKINIILSSFNYEQVLQQRSELEQLINKDTKLSICLQSDLLENECIIEHPYGKIDISINTQLTEIYKTLMDLNQEYK